MILRLVAIGFIFVCTAIAWGVLGTTVFSRTYSQSGGLRNKVEASWGTSQIQLAPVATYAEQRPQLSERYENGQKTTTTTMATVQVPIVMLSSDVKTALNLDYRQKGLLWYSTYAVDFQGTYGFQNSTSEARDVEFTLRLPAAQAIYDNLVFQIDGQTEYPVSRQSDVSVKRKLDPGQKAMLKVGYRSQGLDAWRYSFGNEVNQVRNFALQMTTNFKDIDFPENSLSPTAKHQTPNGWDLKWQYENLVSGYQIAMVMPQHLQPGPLAGEISYFAPVSLFFFFFLMFIITTLRGIELHPMNYFFLASAFFAFHLLLAYLVDHISIHAAFVICSAVSIFLVVSYLRLVTGPLFAVREAALGQLIYLVLFSYAFFFKGFTGLAITIGAIVTLFVVMQMTGKIRWEEKFTPLRRTPPPIPAAE